MENNLADRLYEASQQTAPSGIEVDELGIPFKINHDSRYHCSYITARCLKRNPHLHTRPDGYLYNSHTRVSPRLEDIIQLADWAGPITKQQAIFIYHQLKKLALKLDPDVIAITPTLGWRFSTQSFEKPPKGQKEFNVISDW